MARWKARARGFLFHHKALPGARAKGGFCPDLCRPDSRDPGELPKQVPNHDEGPSLGHRRWLPLVPHAPGPPPNSSGASIHCDCPVLGSACSSLVPPPTSRSLPTSSSACYCCATASAAWVPLQATALGRGTIRAKSWCRRQLAAHACIRCRRPGWLDAQADPILADPFSLEAHCYASAAAAAALPSHSQSKVLGPKMLIPSCESLAPRQN